MDVLAAIEALPDGPAAPLVPLPFTCVDAMFICDEWRNIRLSICYKVPMKAKTHSLGFIRVFRAAVLLCTIITLITSFQDHSDRHAAHLRCRAEQCVMLRQSRRRYHY